MGKKSSENGDIRIYSGKLFAWQQAASKFLLRYPKNTILTILAPRQIGKTHWLEMFSLCKTINNPNFRVVIVNPTFANAKKTYQDLSRYLEMMPKNIVRNANASDLLITFVNNSTIQLNSMEQGNALRGNHCDLLFLDEAAFLDTNTAMSVLFPYVNATQGDIVLISTPKFKDENNLFYKFYKLGKESDTPKISTIDWTKYDTSEILSYERKKLLRETMPWNIYANEILGEFLTERSELWDFTDILRNDIVATDYMFGGLDWGSTGSDETVLSVFNANKQQYALIRLKGTDYSASEQVVLLVERIMELNLRYVVYETNSIGSPMADFLKREAVHRGCRCQFVPFTTDNKSKRRIIENLQILIQNKSITLLDDNTLKLQFAQFEVKKTPSGLITYGNASDNVHDDIVIATALALSNDTNGTYCIG